MALDLKKMKQEIKDSGINKSKIMYFKEDTKRRVRFLTDMEDGTEIVFHDSYKLGVNVPCQEQFGKECPYCENEDLRTRSMYAWSVYDYESKEVRVLLFAVNNCTPVPAMLSAHESYGTLKDRDYEIKRVGKAQNTTYSLVGLDKSKFQNKKVKAFSEQAILKIINKAYPDPDADDEEEEEDEKPVKKTGKKSGSKKQKTESEEAWEELEKAEKETEYEDMTAKELYKLCKERDLECVPKKSKDYYIDLLEEADEEEEDDEWDDEDEEEDWD